MKPILLNSPLPTSPRTPETHTEKGKSGEGATNIFNRNDSVDGNKEKAKNLESSLNRKNDFISNSKIHISNSQGAPVVTSAKDSNIGEMSKKNEIILDVFKLFCTGRFPGNSSKKAFVNVVAFNLLRRTPTRLSTEQLRDFKSILKDLKEQGLDKGVYNKLKTLTEKREKSSVTSGMKAQNF